MRRRGDLAKSDEENPRIIASSQKRINALSLSTLIQLGYAVGKGASLAEC
jgi:hypothetical protein